LIFVSGADHSQVSVIELNETLNLL